MSGLRTRCPWRGPLALRAHIPWPVVRPFLRPAWFDGVSQARQGVVRGIGEVFQKEPGREGGPATDHAGRKKALRLAKGHGREVLMGPARGNGFEGHSKSPPMWLGFGVRPWGEEECSGARRGDYKRQDNTQKWSRYLTWI